MNRGEASHYYAVIPEGVILMGPHPLAVYAALRLLADARSDECWPSVKTLAERAGLGTTATREALRELRDAGWITWLPRQRDDGSFGSNVYRVFGAVARGAGDPAERVDTTSEGGGGAPSHGGGAPSHGGGGTPSRGGGTPSGVGELLPIELLPIEEQHVGTPQEYRQGDSADLGDPEPANPTEPTKLTEPTNPTEPANPTDPTEPESRRHAKRLVYEFSSLLTDLGVKHRVTEKWVTDFDRMIRLDARDPVDISRAMRWALADPFWQANIHSPMKLRQQYDRLRLTAARGGPGQSRVDDARDLIRLYEAQEATDAEV